MKILAAASMFVLLGVNGFAQSRSVWIEDYTANEVVAAVGAGKTTLIYCGSALHADGPAITVGKHIYVGRQVAQRVAEELGDALVLPVNPYAPAGSQMAPTYAVAGGTVSLSDEVYALVTKDVVNSAILAVRKSEGAGTGFKHVMVMSDHTQGQETLQKVAKELDQDWKSKGVRVHYIDVALIGKKLMSDYLSKRDIPARRHTPIDDDSELMRVDRNRVRVDKIPPEDRIASPELGKIFMDFKVNSAVDQIRKAVAEK